MRGKLDENMPAEAAAVLEAVGWECDTVLHEALGGTEDPHAHRLWIIEPGRVRFREADKPEQPRT